MFNLGWLEVGLILLAAILIFGPKKIPELGGAFGKTLRELKDGLQGTTSSDDGDADDAGRDIEH